eukprot:4062249-Ditylum_brightwellii.AAC.2
MENDVSLYVSTRDTKKFLTCTGTYVVAMMSEFGLWRKFVRALLYGYVVGVSLYVESGMLTQMPKVARQQMSSWAEAPVRVLFTTHDPSGYCGQETKEVQGAGHYLVQLAIIVASIE